MATAGEPHHQVEELHRLCHRLTSKGCSLPCRNGSIPVPWSVPLGESGGLQCLREQQQASWGGEQGCAHECVMRAFQRLGLSPTSWEN